MIIDGGPRKNFNTASMLQKSRSLIWPFSLYWWIRNSFSNGFKCFAIKSIPFWWIKLHGAKIRNNADIRRFSVNLGGKQILQSLTIYLIINTLVNIIKLQMCVFFRIFVCAKKKEKSPICRAQRYKEIWTLASNWPDKIACEWKMSPLAYLAGRYDE